MSISGIFQDAGHSGPLPLVSVVVPVRNEEGHIAGCLNGILEGSYPLDRLEILVIDGQSTDGTARIVQDFCERFSCVRLLSNPARIVPHAMNIGIRAARGELIVGIDAHTRYGPEYISELVAWMQRLNADNVGGVLITRPGNNTAQAKAVALVLSHPFGVGGAQYRLARARAPIEVDTVPFGCYRRELFERIGLYDEMLVRNQDDELNGRLKKAGGRIFLVPQIRIEYFARESLRKFMLMLYQYGYFKPLVAIKLGRPATWRQFAPPIFTGLLVGLLPLSLFAPVALYLWLGLVGAHTLSNILASVTLARSEWRLVPYLLGGFLGGHVAYGWGYLRGFLDFALLRRHVNRRVGDAPLSR